MSGGHFDYTQWQIQEIARKIQIDIARALKPKPEMVHQNYWVVNVHETPTSWHILYGITGQFFKTFEEAESYLLADRTVVPTSKRYDISANNVDDVFFESTYRKMRQNKNGERLPLLYSIHHCEYDAYPSDVDVLELTDETIDRLKEAYVHLRKAYIYAQRVDWMMSGDDGEESFHERLKKELDDLDKEISKIDWTTPFEDWEEDCQLPRLVCDR